MKATSSTILLSFDIEEFDMPMEYGKNLSFMEQISISKTGTDILLNILNQYGIEATFFCTANFARHSPESIREMVNSGHEIASHGYYHSRFEDADLLRSRLTLEEIGGLPVQGFRMPRMAEVNLKALKEAGYVFNSSLNPTFLPGRYNHMDKPRTYFIQEGSLQIPSSVSPLFRFPLFWLSFHVLSFSWLKPICQRTIQKDGYLNLYFHPWEFTDLRDRKKLGMPWYVEKRSGRGMIQQLEELILWGQKSGYRFQKISNFMDSLAP